MSSETERVSFSQRLQAAMAVKGYAEEDRIAILRKWTGVGREGVRKWLTGMSIPRKPHIMDLSKRLSCRSEWLEYGDGPMSLEVDRDPRAAALLKLAEERLDGADTEELEELIVSLRRLLR
jgi:hypothetical protein